MTSLSLIDWRFVKYCAVGVLNTLITLGVIFVCKSVIGLDPYLSNILGYVAGVANSFIWNKNWVFQSDGGYGSEGLRFLGGFAICYALQFATVWTLTQSSLGPMEFHLPMITLSGYGVATLIGNVVYTVANFLYNKIVTFKA